MDDNCGTQRCYQVVAPFIERAEDTNASIPSARGLLACLLVPYQRSGGENTCINFCDALLASDIQPPAGVVGWLTLYSLLRT